MKRKIPALAIAVALLGSVAAFAGNAEHGGASSAAADGAVHKLEADVKGAFHKIGTATRHVLRRADASLHRGSSKGSSDAARS